MGQMTNTWPGWQNVGLIGEGSFMGLYAAGSGCLASQASAVAWERGRNVGV